jgi:hypothetical protein
MIADLVSTLAGLWLTYVAIFPHAPGMGRDRIALLAAIAMIGLALWARRSGARPWQSAIVLATGALLAVLMITHQVIEMSDVLMFWGILWAGLVCATVSLWGALYRSPRDAGLTG